MGILATDFVEINPTSSSPFSIGKSANNSLGIFIGAADSGAKKECINVKTDGTVTFKTKVVMPSNVQTADLSDIRFKENLSPIHDCMSKVHMLNGVTFNYKGDTERRAGLIAQDVQRVLPEGVVETNEQLLVDYPSVLALLVNAFKEQTKEIQSLKSQIDYLRSKLHA